VRFAFALKAHTATENEWTSVLITTVGGVGLILAGDAGSSATKVETDAIKNAVVTGDTSMLRKTDIKP
jgi:hypothetical protein